MALSEPQANDVLNATFNRSALQVTSVYFALFSTAPTASSSGTELAYASGYARYGLDSFTAASGGFIATNATVAFSATAAWLDVAAVGAFNAGSAGQRIFQHTLSNVIAVDSGESVVWAGGDLEWIIVSCAT